MASCVVSFWASWSSLAEFWLSAIRVSGLRSWQGSSRAVCLFFLLGLAWFCLVVGLVAQRLLFDVYLPHSSFVLFLFDLCSEIFFMLFMVPTSSIAFVEPWILIVFRLCILGCRFSSVALSCLVVLFGCNSAWQCCTLTLVIHAFTHLSSGCSELDFFVLFLWRSASCFLMLCVVISRLDCRIN